MECFKCGLMGHPNRNMEDFAAKSYLNCADLVQEVSVCDIKTFFGVLVKNGCLLSLSEESA